MRFKETFKYISISCRKNLIIFYISSLIFSFIIALLAVLDGEEFYLRPDVFSFMMVSIVYNSSYRQNKLMLLQNGISRKTYFWAELSFIGVISVIFAFLENIIFLIGNLFIKNINIQITYNFICKIDNSNLGVKDYAISLLVELGMLLLLISLFSVLCKLLDRFGNIVVFIFFILIFNAGLIIGLFGKDLIFIGDILGITNNKIYRLGISTVIVILLLNTASYLVMRKSAIRLSL